MTSGDAAFRRHAAVGHPQLYLRDAGYVWDHRDLLADTLLRPAPR